jgi:hypothetical protein
MPEQKPKRLEFETYQQRLLNSAGTAMFRNWYVETSEQRLIMEIYRTEDWDGDS